VRSRARVTPVMAIVGVLALARGARGDVCGEPRHASGGPLPGGTDVADFGATPETCAGADFGMRWRATALVASTMPDYYGALAASSTLRLRRRLGPTGRTWLAVAADVATYRYVVNAVVASSGFAFGPPTVGLHRSLGDGAGTATSVYARALLPLDTARQNSVRFGLELGATARRLIDASGRFGFQGGIAFLEPVVVVAGQTHAATQSAVLVEGWFAPGWRLALFAGAEGRAELTPNPSFLTLAPRLAARLALRNGLGLAMLAEAPVFGEDRTDFIGALYVTWSANQ